MGWLRGLLSGITGGAVKTNQEVDCRRRCKSWFPYDKELEKGCVKGCYAGKNYKSPEAYLASIGALPPTEDYGGAYTGPVQQPGNSPITINWSNILIGLLIVAVLTTGTIITIRFFKNRKAKLKVK